MTDAEARGLTLEEAASQLTLTVEQVRDLIAAGALQVVEGEAGPRVTADSMLIYRANLLTASLKRLTRRPSTFAIASEILLPLVLVLWFMAACAEVFSLRDHKPIVAVPTAIAALTLTLAVAWWLARQTEGFTLVKGTGTTLYGRRMTPTGRVGTQYVVFAGVPLLPLRSYVILEASEEKANWSGMIRTRNYHLRVLDRIYWRQALPVLLGVWAGLGALVAVAILS